MKPAAMELSDEQVADELQKRIRQMSNGDSELARTELLELARDVRNAAEKRFWKPEM